MKTLKSSLAAVLCCGAPTLVLADTTATCHDTNVAEIAGLFDRWNDSLKTKDPDKVAANYAPDGVLLPTVSNKPRTNTAEIRDYFVSFLKKEPQGRIDRRIIKIGCNEAIDAGVYTFSLKGEDGKVSDVQARYTYTYEYKNGQWLISSHHSSVMPEKPATATAAAKPSVVVHLSQFTNDLQAAFMALNLAGETQIKGGDVTLLLDLEAVRAVDARQPQDLKWGRESQGNFAQMYDMFIKSGGKVMVSSTSAKEAGITAEGLRPGAKIASDAEIAALLVQADKILDY